MGIFPTSFVEIIAESAEEEEEEGASDDAAQRESGLHGTGGSQEASSGMEVRPGSLRLAGLSYIWLSVA